MSRDLQDLVERQSAVQARQETANAERDSIRDALRNNEIALRLESIETDLQAAATRRKEKGEYHQQFVSTLRNLGIELAIEDGGQFRAAQERLAVLKDQSEKTASESWETARAAAIELAENRKRHFECERELQAAREHKVSIPAVFLTIRAKLCSAISVGLNDLPYAGELIEVRDEYSNWRGAIERLLHSFAVSLLVPPVHYAAVSRWVDSNNLGIRFVFLLVNDRSQSVIGGALAANRVPARLNFKTDHPLHPWIAAEVPQRFKHVCVDDPAQLRQENFGISLNGLIKDGPSRHIKDDRNQINDSAHWVLGWSAEAKIKSLARLSEEIATRNVALMAQERSAVDKHQKGQQNLIAISNLLIIDSFSKIDFYSEERTIGDLSRKKAETEAISEPAKNLRKQKQEIEKVILGLREEARQMDEEKGRLDSALTDCGSQIASLSEFVSQGSELDMGLLQSLFNPLQEQADLNLDNYDAVSGAVVGQLKHSAERQGTTMQRSREKILPLMGDFLKAYPAETSDLYAEFSFAKEFVALRQQLEAEKLPEYRQRFRAFLDENLLTSLANFHAKLQEHENEIKQRIAKVNEALKDIPYSATTYVQIKDLRTPNREIADFRSRLTACFSGSLSDSDEARELVLQKIQALMADFEQREDWKRKVTDVRNWLEFAVSERENASGNEVNYITESGGRSGGQKAKLAFTILASAIMSQYGLTYDKPDQGTFRFVVIDEAFSRTDEENSQQALDLFKRLDLQLLVVSPFDARARLVEDYVDTFHVATNPNRDSSKISRANRVQYEEARDSARENANGH